MTFRSACFGLSALIFLAVTPPVSASPVIVSPAAKFSANATTLNPGNSADIFDNLGREAFVEFGLGFAQPQIVTFGFTVLDNGFATGDPQQRWNIAYYAGNGAADLSDLGAGTFLTSLSMPAGSFTPFVLDVTSQVLALRAANATHIGFRFYGANFGQLVLRSPAYQAPILNVTLAPAGPQGSVPEPASLTLVGLGLAGLVASRRKSVSRFR